MRLSKPHSRPKVGIEIPDIAGNWTQATGVEDRESADYVIAETYIYEK